MTEEQFRAQLVSQGFTDIEVLEREANLSNDDHTHDFTASALILDGEISVTTAEGTTTCGVGDTFMLDGGVVHHETYGPQGARFLLGRRAINQ